MANFRNRTYHDSLIADAAPMPFGVAHALSRIYQDYADYAIIKPKTLLKFGRFDSVGTTAVTVQQTGGTEVLPTTNAIDTISSSELADTQDITIEGHTVTGTGTDAQFTFAIQTKTLTGQTKAVLSTPLARVSRAYVNDATVPTGKVYIYEDTTISAGVPTDATKIHLTIEGDTANTQSYKAATTFSSTDYFIMTTLSASIDKKTSAVADFELQTQTVGGIFRPNFRFGLSTTGSNSIAHVFDPPLIIPKNADVRIRATASTSGVEVDASFNGYLATTDINGA